MLSEYPDYQKISDEKDKVNIDALLSFIRYTFISNYWLVDYFLLFHQKLFYTKNGKDGNISLDISLLGYLYLPVSLLTSLLFGNSTTQSSSDEKMVVELKEKKKE